MEPQVGTFATKRSQNPRVLMPLHRSADGFIPPEQFRTFYWPTLRKFLVGLIDGELTAWVFFEVDYTSRLNIIRDIPAGKAIHYFERTDIFRAKKV